ncbi:MAG: hypothetical protein ACKVRN_08505 [Pyrinomonadaceae bacterium]
MIRNVINWNYERASWQWDFLCLVILAFIFLTPKEWFEKAKTPANQTATAIVQSDSLSREVKE